MGIAAGMGREATAVLSTLFALLILMALRIPLDKAERRLKLKAAEAGSLVKKEADDDK